MKKKSWTGWIHKDFNVSEVFAEKLLPNGGTIDQLVRVFRTRSDVFGYPKKIRITVEEVDTKPRSVRWTSQVSQRNQKS